MRTRCLSMLVLVCLAGGCMSGAHRFSRPRAEAYINSHPELPGPVAERLLVGRVEVGMSKDAVRICMGPPDRRRTTTVGGEPREVWEFSEPASRSDELRHSDMWETEIPTARVRFGDDDRVEAYWYFGTRIDTRLPHDNVPPPPRKVSERAAPPAATPARPDPRGSKAAPSGGRPEEPRANRLPADWPMLTLNGVSLIGDAPYAMINRTVVVPGEKIDGVTLLYVRQDGVYLGLGESISFLSIGKTLEK